MRQQHLTTFVGGLAAALTLTLMPATVSAQTEFTGQTSGGAHYRIDVPDGWTPAGGLVIWNHGFSLDPPGPVDDLGPLRDVQLAEGYAVAASSYSQTGWAVYRSRADIRKLVKVFRRRVGNPQTIFVSGQGMGALVTAQIIERGGMPEVVGGLPISGTMAGSAVWKEGVDMRLMYDVACDNVPGAQIPGGANGLPPVIDPLFDAAEMANRVDACLGTSTPPKDRTPQQNAWLNFFRDVTGGSRNDVVERMHYSTFGLHDLVFDPRKQNGRRGIGNRGATYADPFIDAGITRVGPEGNAGRLARNYTPTGRVGDVKIVSIHTDRDGLVIVENESEYASVVPPQNLTVGIVSEAQPSHAGFSAAETVAAWESLRAWAAGMPQPSVQDIQNTCESLVATGAASGKCRYDPGFVIPPYRGFRQDP